MTTTVPPPAPQDGAPDEHDVPRVLHVHRSRADRLYRRGLTGIGGSTLVIMAAIGGFLLIAAIPALREAGLSFFTTSEWQPDNAEPRFGIVAVVLGTVKVGFVAMVIAVPLSVCCSLFINEYAPAGLRRVLVALVDLLAAIPSLIFGLWGFDVLQPTLIPVADLLDERLGFIPLFNSETGKFNSSYFVAGCVVSLMVLPIATSVIRQVFSQAPAAEKEGALAVGGTRWGMIRTVVLPFGRGGIIGGSMLGLGRALAEAIAVSIILAPTFETNASLVQDGGSTIAALIALQYFDAKEMGISALMAAGLVLFTVTLFVNMAASAIVSRSRSGSGVDA